MSDMPAKAVDLDRHYERAITGHRVRCAKPETDAERLTKELNAPDNKEETNARAARQCA